MEKGIQKAGTILLVSLVTLGSFFVILNITAVEMGFIEELPFESLTGVTVLSIDKIQLQSNVKEYAGDDAFLVTMVADGGGEKLVGEITQEDLNRYGITGVTAKPFKITVELEDQYFDFPLKQDKYFSGEDLIIYKIYGSTASRGCLRDDVPYGSVNLESTKLFSQNKWVDPQVVSQVPPILPRGIEEHIPSTSWDKAISIGEWGYWMPEETSFSQDGECITQVTQAYAQRGDWYATHLAGVPYLRPFKIGDQGNIRYKARITMEVDGGETLSTYLTDEQTVNNIEDIARVKWVGGLLARQTPPIPGLDYAVVKFVEQVPTVKTKYGAVIEPNRAKFVQKEIPIDYKLGMQSLADLDQNYFVYSWSDPPEMPIRVEERIITRTVRVSVPVDPGVGAEYIVGLWNRLNDLTASSVEDVTKPEDCEIVGGVVRCRPAGDVIYPQIQMLIRASWLGLEILSGQPALLDIDVPRTTYEGEIATLKIGVKNNAEVDDSFDLSMGCKPDGMNIVNNRVGIKAGEERDVAILFSGGSNIYNCTVSLLSVNNPLSKVTEPVLISIITKPLPRQIILLEDIPQAQASLEARVKELMQTTNALIRVVLILGAVIVGAGITYFLIRMQQRRK